MELAARPGGLRAHGLAFGVASLNLAIWAAERKIRRLREQRMQGTLSA